jgi:hypothetical protein
MYGDLGLSQVIAASEAVLFVSFVCGVILHEAGHAIAARLVGLDLRLVAIGHGPALLHVKRLGVTFVLRSVPLSGFVAIAVRPGMSRYRFAIMIASGPGANLVLLIVTIVLDRMAPYYDAVLMPAGFAQLLLLLLTLTPFKSKARGRVRPSDGLQLWRQLVRKPPDVFTTQYATLMTLVFPTDRPAPHPSPAACELVYQVLRSDRMIDAWAMRDAVASVRTLLGPWQLNMAERAVALDFLVSSEVLLGGTEIIETELEMWSAEACILAPGIATTLTRAGVLATTGRAEQAMDMLLALPECEGTRPIVSIFRYWLHMAQAAAARGWDGTVKQSLDMARKAADARVAHRGMMKQILARAERIPPLHQ